MLKDLPTTMIAMIVLYVFSLAYGLNFVVAGVALGIGGAEFALIALIVLLPAFLFFLYFMRGSVELLYGKERPLRMLSYIFTLISVVFTTIFIVPISY
jgi:hypothetical protein